MSYGRGFFFSTLFSHFFFFFLSSFIFFFFLELADFCDNAKFHSCFDTQQILDFHNEDA